MLLALLCLKNLYLQHIGITTTISRLEFNASFKLFIHRWEKFTGALLTHRGETKIHLELLHNVLKEEVGEIIASKEDFIANEVITFGLVWTLF